MSMTIFFKEIMTKEYNIHNYVLYVGPLLIGKHVYRIK